jgi:hypothetical protein
MSTATTATTATIITKITEEQHNTPHPTLCPFCGKAVPARPRALITLESKDRVALRCIAHPRCVTKFQHRLGIHLLDVTEILLDTIDDGEAPPLELEPLQQELFDPSTCCGITRTLRRAELEAEYRRSLMRGRAR